MSEIRLKRADVQYKGICSSLFLSLSRSLIYQDSVLISTFAGKLFETLLGNKINLAA